MGDRGNTDDRDGNGVPRTSNADISGRLKSLDIELKRVDAERKLENAKANAEPSRTSTVSGMTLAFRLGSEFVAGVLVGAGLGYGVDMYFDTAPLGMIVLILLGFGAGVLNMLRATGEFGRKPKNGSGKKG